MRKTPSGGRRAPSTAKKSSSSSSKKAGKPSSSRSTGSSRLSGGKKAYGPDTPEGGRPAGRSSSYGGTKRVATAKKPLPSSNAPMRLNRFISNSGICSRREADVLIESGAVMVNGEIIVSMGHKVAPTDNVQVGGESIRPDTKRYVLLNKPKGFGTSAADFKARRGVMELVQKACKEEIRPLDKLDRESTGLMFFTNDEPLAVRLNDPRGGMKRLYHVVLAEKFNSTHLEAMKAGFVLDEGFVKAFEVEVVGEDRHQIGLQVMSSRSRVARRMFEHFGYKVLKVDRVMLGPLSKKNVPRGTWRHLTPAEINMLRMTS
jgi:23S rRNA pseudouridine2605 synthase